MAQLQRAPKGVVLQLNQPNPGRGEPPQLGVITCERVRMERYGTEAQLSARLTLKVSAQPVHATQLSSSNAGELPVKVGSSPSTQRRMKIESWKLHTTRGRVKLSPWEGCSAGRSNRIRSAVGGRPGEGMATKSPGLQASAQLEQAQCVSGNEGWRACQ